ncbi:MAG: hypothetical protein ACOYT4_03515 [Nanoarchaeota archaeon]
MDKEQNQLENKIVKYLVKWTKPFPVSEGINYIIDLPEGQLDKTAVVRSKCYLNDGDMLRLPNNLWLEVSKDKDRCFGYSGTIFGKLEILESAEDIEKKLQDERLVGHVYPTLATYIA